MKIRLNLDEDTSRNALIEALRRSSIEVISTLEANNLGKSDEQQFIYAAQNNMTIYTYNMRDFCRLHKVYMEQGINHAGIIIAERQSYSIGEQLKGIQSVINTFSHEEMKNNLVFIGAYIRDS
jgi:hypothetical protein